MRVVAFVTDLMDRSKITRVGEVSFARHPSEAAGADIVVIDLGAHAGLVRAVRQAAPGARIVSYGRHTEVDVLRCALEDGADEAFPRSRFFADPAAAITQTSGQG